ncbi:MAG: multiheme c-type cytochrome [Pseudomonadota bacterium]
MKSLSCWTDICGVLLVAGLFLFATQVVASSEKIVEPKKVTLEKKIIIDQFISPETCAGCHSAIVEQWENSMHSLSHKDPVYFRLAKMLRKGLVDKGEIQEAESCVKCHTPVGNVSGFPKQLSDDLSKTPEIATKGIQCDYCHSARTIKRMYNNGLVLNPGNGEDDPGIKYGPFDDAQPDFHEAQYSKIHTESEICGTCHDVKHVAFGTDLETTYTEWKNSVYNSKDPEKKITCQGCHMYQRPGVPATGSTLRPENPGSATDYSDERPHIFTHYFVGGNAAVPAMFGDQDKSIMATDRLKNAATIGIDTGHINQNKINVIVTNTGAGHSIPTGLGDLRQVWLEIVVKDKDNQIQYATGLLDTKGELSDDALVFKNYLGDGKGNSVINVSKARQIIKDTRIKAKQSVVNTIELGFKPQKDAVITARLLYRSVPQKILKLIPGKPFDPLPVIEMARVTKRL